MSVYIRGMEMPKNCRFCRLAQMDDGYVCSITGEAYSWGLNSPPSECPIIPVPDHGRLIDADALLATERETFEDYHISEAATVIPADKEDEE